MSELLTSLVAGLVSILAGGFAGWFVELSRRFVTKTKQPMSVAYSEKIATLTHSLVDASSEVDRVLKEMSAVSGEKEAAILALEQKLRDLIEREKYLQEKIQTLQNVPLPAAQYFVNEVKKGERHIAWRDYFLFVLGVAVSTAVAITLKLVFGI